MKIEVASSVPILAAVGLAEKIRYILSKGDLRSSNSQPENAFQKQLSYSNEITLADCQNERIKQN